MAFAIRVIIVAVCLGVAVLIQKYRQLSRPLPAPQLDLEQYWGPGSSDKYREDISVKPFDISVKPELIEDLKTQLKRPLKLQEPLEGIGFEYGFNSIELKKVIKYWSDSYLTKWDERQKYWKKFPHFQTQIQGLNIHFIHAKPTQTNGKKVLPLLLIHGWPGSVREFYEILPLLTKPNPKSEFVFEVIVPSLPGYGWSQGASKTGFGPAQIAVVFRNLMLRLGHEKFVVQGGDWGSIIGSNIATFFPQNVLGYHSNMCNAMGLLSTIKMFIGSVLPNYFIGKENADFYGSPGQVFSYLIEESGYFHIQATKPDTIGAALQHNPVGLAAYILEKFSTWTNGGYRKLSDGGLTKRYTLDALLDNVMIYYVTNSITTSQRLYSEAFTIAQFSLQVDRVPIVVPTGCARFKHDLMHSTDFQLKDKFVDLVHSTHHRDGGHFAAMELPKVFYEDFIQFTNKAFGTKSKQQKSQEL